MQAALWQGAPHKEEKQSGGVPKSRQNCARGHPTKCKRGLQGAISLMPVPRQSTKQIPGIQSSRTPCHLYKMLMIPKYSFGDQAEEKKARMK